MYNLPKDDQSGDTNRYVYSDPDTKLVLVLEAH